jgi:hypothetical protein
MRTLVEGLRTALWYDVYQSNPAASNSARCHMSIYQVVDGGAVIFTFSANFSKAASPIQLCDSTGTSSKETPFRVSDSRSPLGAARLINGWCRTNGEKCWAQGARGLILRRIV